MIGSNSWTRWINGSIATIVTLIVLVVVLGRSAMCYVPIVLMMIGALIWRVRRGHAQVILGYLHHAVKSGQSIVRVIDWACEDEATGTGRRLRALSMGLRGGQSLRVSLEQALPEISPRELNLIALGERTGQLGVMLDRLMSNTAQRDRAEGREPGVAPGVMFGVLGVSAMAFGLAGMGLVALLVPMLVELFSNYDVPLPAELLNFSGQRWAVVMGVWGTLAWGGLCMGAVIFTGCGAAKGRWSAGWSWLIDPLIWYLPFVGASVRARALSDWCYGMSRAVEAGLSLHRAASDAGLSCGNRVLARRTVQMTRMLEAGVELHEAASRSRMPRVIVSLLGPAHSHERMVRALDFLTGHYEARFSRVQALLSGAVIPVLVLINGLLIGSLAVWVVRCIVAMLEALMRDSPLWGAL